MQTVAVLSHLPLFFFLSLCTNLEHLELEAECITKRKKESPPPQLREESSPLASLLESKLWYNHFRIA